MSQMLGQTFWRVHEPSVEGEWGDVVVRLSKLEKVLDKIDRIQNVPFTKQTILQESSASEIYMGDKEEKSETGEGPVLHDNGNTGRIVFD